MDSILAPSVDGSFQTIFGHECKGLFAQKLGPERFLFRHSASGHSLFHLLGDENMARDVQQELAQRYDFTQDSTWVLKGQGQIHRLLVQQNLSRQWLHRSWHYTRAY